MFSKIILKLNVKLTKMESIMRYISIIIAMLVCFSLATAEQNPVVESTHNTVKVKVITPFSIVNDQGNGNDQLPDIPAGQSVTFQSPKILKLFKMTKEAGYKVRLNLDCEEENNGLEIEADWYFSEDQPNNPTYTWDDPLNQAFDWYGPPTDAWIFVAVNSVDASNASAGSASFTATANGHYINL